ncbi:MAG: helix-turn-helix domain-containing protein [Oscillospiraceae bacterium]|nr:helix-turn-helix domain-containing protein [Oscillospiraceae bacterium]
MDKKPILSFPPVGNEKQNDINVYIGGYLDHISKGFSIGPFMRDFYAIDYCTRGGFTLYIDEVATDIKEGDFYIIPPNTPMYKIFTADVTSTVYVGAKGAKLPHYLNLLGFSDKKLVFPYKLNERAISYFHMLVNSLEVCEHQSTKPDSTSHAVTFHPNPDFSNHLSNEAPLRQTAYFSLFLSELMNIYGTYKNEEKKHSVQQKYIDSAVRYIETNYPLDITVDGIAAHVGLTRSYLFKLFREYVGMSVNDYIIQTRMRAACDFLCQPEVQIKTVAASVGYEPYNFSKMFKKAIGISPTEYHIKNSK